MPPRHDDPRIAAALARNERYVREFVEAFNLCPYAKRCRETGKLHRAVLLDAGGSPGTTGFDTAVDSLAEAIAQIECLPSDSIEVGLVLLPALVPALTQGIGGARAFEQLVSAARARIEARPRDGTGRSDPPFYCVAFHPHFAEDLRDEHRAVRFIRRSPDPTVQLVRGSVLRAVRGADPSGSQYADIAGLSATQLMALAAPVSVSDRIARANLRTINASDADRLRSLLAEFSTRAI